MNELTLYPLDEQPHPCMYLPGLTAHFESYIIPNPTLDLFVSLIERGFRHFGPYFFRPACRGVDSPWCGACVPLRISVPRFAPSPSQRRVLRHGAEIRMVVAPPQCDARRHAIYCAHNDRFPPLPNGALKQDLDYETFALSFYVNAPFMRECTYFAGDRLIAFSLLDVAPPLASTIYCAFDPAFETLSPGTLSVLREIEYAQSQHLDYYYLGYTMQTNPSLAYKQAFRPSEYPSGAEWRPLRDAKGNWQANPATLRTQPTNRIISSE